MFSSNLLILITYLKESFCSNFAHWPYGEGELLAAIDHFVVGGQFQLYGHRGGVQVRLCPVEVPGAAVHRADHLHHWPHGQRGKEGLQHADDQQKEVLYQGLTFQCDAGNGVAVETCNKNTDFYFFNLSVSIQTEHLA